VQPLWNVVEGRAVSAVVGLSGGVNWVRLCGCVSEGWGCGIEFLKRGERIFLSLLQKEYHHPIVTPHH